jgi:alpha-tubulin suppressor-like RCC1 family protein
MSTNAWGNNQFGQLGDGTFINSNVPVPVIKLTGPIAIAGGIFHSLGVLSGGSVSAWGANFSGQLGNGTNAGSNIPETVNGLVNANQVAAGAFHSLALLSDGTIKSWGDNFTGQLGNGAFNDSSVPVSVSGLSDAIAIAAGLNHSLTLLKDGTVRAWGGNFFGQLGNGTDITSNLPVPVIGLINAIAIAGGGGQSLALLKDGTVRAWGNNQFGQLGDGSSTNSMIPVLVKGTGGIGVLGDVIAIATGELHSLALLKDGTVRAWGANFSGQLGDGTNTNSKFPVLVKGTGGVGFLGNVTAIATEGFHSLALLKDGTVRAWGNNFSGQLGDGTNINSDIPITVNGLTNTFIIAGGGDHSLSLQPIIPPPTITCSANIIQFNDPGQCGAIVNYPPPLVSDQCPEGFTFSCTPPSGSFFPVGTTTVTCTVTNFCGGAAACSFNVSVIANPCLVGGTVSIDCFLSDSQGNRLDPLAEGSVLCREIEQIGGRQNVTVTLPNRRMVILQKVKILKQGFVVVQVSGMNITMTTAPIPFQVEETFLLCAPTGTHLQCEITDFECEVRMTCDANQNFQQLDLFISMCQSVQMEADIKLEVEGILCVPRMEISTFCSPRRIPSQCPEVFSSAASLLTESTPHLIGELAPFIQRRQPERVCIRTIKVYDWVTRSVDIILSLGSDQVNFICR